MPWQGLVTQAVGLGVMQGGPLGRMSRAVAFRLCAAAVRAGRPVIRGRLRTGARIYLDVRDPAHREILWTGETEPGSARLLRRIVQPGWTMVDVGANAGFYSLLSADLGASSVLAFEPNPRMVALLKRSAHGSPVEVVAAACGDRDGETPLFVSPDPGKAAFATIMSEAQWSDDWGPWAPVAVPLVTLDDECAARALRPNLVKIDAEGAESDVIRGMTSMLERRTPAFILCEVAAGWERPDPAQWIAMLEAAGYEPSAVKDDGTLRPFLGPIDQTVQNVCFERR